MLGPNVSLQEKKKVPGRPKRNSLLRTYRSIFSDCDVRGPTRRRISRFMKPFPEAACFEKNPLLLKSIIARRRLTRFCIEPRKLSISRQVKYTRPFLFSNCPSSLSSNMISSHKWSAELNFQASLIPESSATTLLLRNELSPSWQPSDSHSVKSHQKEFDPSDANFAYNTPIQAARKTKDPFDIRGRAYDLFDSARESFKPRLADLPNLGVFWNNKIRANRLFHLFC